MKKNKIKSATMIFISAMLIIFSQKLTYGLDSKWSVDNMDSLVTQITASGVDLSDVDNGNSAALSNLFPGVGYQSFEAADEMRVKLQIYTGMGIQTLTKGDGRVFVNMVLAGNAADRAGFWVGDQIIGFKEVERYETVRAQLDAMKELPPGRYTCLLIHNNKLVTVPVETETIIYGEINGRILKPGVAYIQISSLHNGASEAFGEALRVFEEQGVKKLILDLRGTGGGSLNEIEGIAENLLPQNTTLYQLYSSSGMTEYKVKAGIASPIQLVVLTDRDSTGAGATLAYGIQKSGKGLHIGEGVKAPIPAERVFSVEELEGYLTIACGAIGQQDGSPDTAVLQPDVAIRINHNADYSITEDDMQGYESAYSVLYTIGDRDRRILFAEEQLYYLGLYSGAVDDRLDQDSYGILRAKGFLTNGKLGIDGLNRLRRMADEKYTQERATGDVMLKEAMEILGE